MKKLLLTTGVLAAVAGSQLGYAACLDSGNPNDISAQCDSTVTLAVANLVVLKGLDDYDFSNPTANGWDGTTGTNALIPGEVCVGTNNAANGVDITFTSNSGSFDVQDGTNPDVSYNVYFNGNATALNEGDVVGVTGGASGLDNLGCTNENFALNVEFTGAALVTAAVGETYTDTVTVTVAPK